jgi:hypothetical protein
MNITGSTDSGSGLNISIVITIVIPILLTIGVLTTVIIIIMILLVQRFWNKFRSQLPMSVKYSEIQVRRQF